MALSLPHSTSDFAAGVTAVGTSVLENDEAIVADYELAFSTYGKVAERSFVFPAATATGNWSLTANSLSTGSVPVYLAAADFAATGRTTKLRVRMTVHCNGTAPTSTFTGGLYPITAGGGATTPTVTIGSLVSGSSSGSIVAPSSNAVLTTTGSDFSIPADGPYTLICTISGSNIAASAQVSVVGEIQCRRV